MKSVLQHLLLGLCLTALSMTQVMAEVQIQDAWVRATAPGQKVGAAYMTLSSVDPSKMVYVETARAGAVEMHFMRMQDGVMKMRQLNAVELPANETVKLAPGGMHLMLFDLDAPLKAGETVDFKVCFEDPAGNITHQTVSLPVK